MKKYIVIGIVILFIGASVVPNITGNVKDRDIPQSDIGLRSNYFFDDRNEFDMDDYEYINPLPNIEPTIWWTLWKLL